jgi:tetratricopeptide (TPR) repeat protein
LQDEYKNIPTQSLPPETLPPAKRSFGSLLRKLVPILRRYWYIVVALIILAGVLIGFQAQRNAQEARWKRATEYFGRVEYDKAAKELKGIPVPKDPERLRTYSQTMLATHQLDNSLTGYKKLYEQKKDPSVKLIIGNIYNEKKDYDNATKIYREAIADNPANVQAYVNLAILYKMRSNMPEAVKVANESVKNNPGSATLRELQVSMLMDDKSTTAYKDAVKALKELNPNDPLLDAINEK